MDDNLTKLESSAAIGAVRYGRFAAVGLGVIAVAAVAFAVYRRSRRPTLRDRLNEVSLERIRDLVDKLREELPSVTVTVNDRSKRETGTYEAIMRKVAPSLVGTASTAVLGRISRRPEAEHQQS